mmetsp:Transcript_34021/g.97855  ORF Transcript_34021/g.97855 Transcript_34021/m.97855 type:complete len:250 (+) Transcript_34021:78-827(+)
MGFSAQKGFVLACTATMPLIASSPIRMSASSPPVYSSSFSDSGLWLTFCTSRFAREAAMGAHSVTLSQTLSTYFEKSISSSTTSVMRPMRLASGAEMLSAVQSIRLAKAAPTFLVRNGAMVRGLVPSFTSETVKRALETATTTSQAASRPMPLPMAEPCARPTENCGRHWKKYRNFMKLTACFMLSASDIAAASAKLLGSPPAQNILPSARRTTMRMSFRLCSSKVASWRASEIPLFSALFASGRFSVM